MMPLIYIFIPVMATANPKNFDRRYKMSKELSEKFLNFVKQSDNTIETILTKFTKDAKVYSSLGSIIAALELRWVFLLFIIVPLLFIFLYEIYEFVIEVKRNMKEV